MQNAHTIDQLKLPKRMNSTGSGAARYFLLSQLFMYTQPLTVRQLQEKLRVEEMGCSRHFINDVIAELKAINPLPGYELKAVSVRTQKGTSKCLAYQFVKVKTHRI